MVEQQNKQKEKSSKIGSSMLSFILLVVVGFATVPLFDMVTDGLSLASSKIGEVIFSDEQTEEQKAQSKLNETLNDLKDEIISSVQTIEELNDFASLNELELVYGKITTEHKVIKDSVVLSNGDYDEISVTRKGVLFIDGVIENYDIIYVYYQDRIVARIMSL